MRLKNLFKRKDPESGIRKDREYLLGEYKIVLKGTHLLDSHQATYPLYDRFLPEFCADLTGLIIDIGANIGDTSIGIFSKNRHSYIVGVEADEAFYSECVGNISMNKLNERFLGINRFVSTRKGKFCVEKNATLSTGSISQGASADEGTNAVSFSELMELIPQERKQPFDLLKIDTDGFDWDIINSFHEFAQSNEGKPQYIFFELQTYLNSDLKRGSGREHMTSKYNASLSKLANDGYDTFCLFDNFGTHIRITSSIPEIIDLCDYICRSQEHNRHSTLYYMDVLAFNKNNKTRVIDKLAAFYTSK